MDPETVANFHDDQILRSLIYTEREQSPAWTVSVMTAVDAMERVFMPDYSRRRQPLQSSRTPSRLGNKRRKPPIDGISRVWRKASQL